MGELRLLRGQQGERRKAKGSATRFEDLEVWKRSARLSADIYRGMQSI